MLFVQLLHVQREKHPNIWASRFQTIELILKKTGAPRDQISFVGDRLYTDVAAGVNNGVTGFLVLTGETKTADLDHAKIRPDGVFLSLKEMGDLLRTSAEKIILC